MFSGAASVNGSLAHPGRREKGNDREYLVADSRLHAIWEFFLPGSTSDEHDLRVLGRAIRELREQRSLGLPALGALAGGIPEADLAAIEAGRLDPGYRRLRRLAAALGVTSTALLLRAEELDAHERP
jgi:helix-turn-helix protein